MFRFLKKLFQKEEIFDDFEEKDEREKIYAKCEICGELVFLPFRCTYCGEYFCGTHRLPPSHNCSGITSWRDKKPPTNGIWEYRRDRTYYRKY